MNKLFIFGVLGLLLVSGVSAYCCIDSQDNQEVIEFKTKINQLAIQTDLDKGVNEQAIITKIKYFHPCKKW